MMLAICIWQEIRKTKTKGQNEMWTSDKGKFSVWQMPGGRLLTGDYGSTPEEMAANAAKEVRSWKVPHLHSEARIEVMKNKKIVAVEKI